MEKVGNQGRKSMELLPRYKGLPEPQSCMTQILVLERQWLYSYRMVDETRGQVGHIKRGSDHAPGTLLSNGLMLNHELLSHVEGVSELGPLMGCGWSCDVEN